MFLSLRRAARDDAPPPFPICTGTQRTDLAKAARERLSRGIDDHTAPIADFAIERE